MKSSVPKISSGEAPDCSVIVRCFNEEKHIGKLLEGLLQQSHDNFEIIIVDSGSKDQTLAIAGRFPVRVVNIPPEAFSFGKSLNLGCHEASGDFIVIISAHCYPVYSDWMERILDPLKDPKTAVVYGKQRGTTNTKFSENQVFEKWFPEESNFDQALPFCNNANAAIRRTVWEKLKYDESLTGLEDIDFAKRVLELDHKIAYNADAEVIHVHNESPMRLLNRYRREAIALKRIFPHEHFSLVDFLRLLTINLAHDWNLSAKRGSLLRNFSSIFLYRLMQFWGTYRGFAQRAPLNPELKQKFYYPNGKINAPKLDNKFQGNRRIKYHQLKMDSDNE